MKKAFFPGTFDPPTLGHQDIIRRAAKLCDELVVAVAVDSSKEDMLFSIDERVGMLKSISSKYLNVKVLAFSGLLIDAVEEYDVQCVIRGMRSSSDYSYESRMALVNRRIGSVETLFLITKEGFEHISSTLIKEVASFGKRLHGFVPDEIENTIFKQISKNS
jgi:pantetheine-phosphate adenylyltransferase